MAVGLALAYAIAAWCRSRSGVRAGLLVAAASMLVVLPTAAFIGMGMVTDRPYGQDGGVVQLPLALEKILGGESPYGADYSDSILGKQARVSDFWSRHGGNPILRHHAYLPGTHLLMMPFYLLLRGSFDPRMVSLLAYAAAALLAVRLVTDRFHRLAALAVVLVNPLVYWQQAFGANDVLIVALLLLAVLLAEGGRPVAAGAILGLACATKQLAWPFAPFFLAYLSGARTLGDLVSARALRRVAGPAAAALAVFAGVVVPVAALDLRAFWGDIVVYNVGLPGGDNYPLGGTPGFGFANFLIYFGQVASLRDHFPFNRFYLFLVPLVVLLLRHQLREGRAATVLVTGSAALLLSLYFSRVVHPNYLILAAVLLPLAFLMDARRPADVALVPLLLLALAAETAESELFRGIWEDAVSVRLPAYLSGLPALLAPRATSELTLDPLGLLFSAAAAGIAVVYLIWGLLGAGPRTRFALALVALISVAVIPTLMAIRVGEAAGIRRAQSAWTASAVPRAREAWSASFRRDPPKDWEVSRPRPVPGLRDPRWLSLVALATIVLVIVRLIPSEGRLPVLGVTVLSPPAVVAAVFGGGEVVALAVLLSAVWLVLKLRSAAASLLLGVGSFLAPAVLFGAPFLVLDPRGWRRALPGLLIGLVVVALCVPAMTFSTGPAGVGLANVALYRGAGPGPAWLALVAAALALGVGFALRGRGPDLTLAAIATLAGLFVTSAAEPHALILPVVLLTLAVVIGRPPAVTS